MQEVQDFWQAQAKKYLKWEQNFTQVQTGEFSQGNITWFADGKLNASVNALDRHVEAGHGSQVAYVYEAEAGGPPQTLTYQELLTLVCQFCSVYADWKLKKGDRVLVYGPSSPQIMAALLACTRMGLVHSVVFAGLSPMALAGRLEDSQAKVLLTTNGLQRNGKNVPLLANVQEAITLVAEKVRGDLQVAVLRHRPETEAETRIPPHFHSLSDLLLSKKAVTSFPAVAMNAEDPLFILYTSGSTGKPKGLLHTHGGYLTQVAYTFDIVFKCQKQDLFWCTADIGWITGHSYVLYGPLLNGVTSFLYEGAPQTPHWGRFWEMIERHRITHLYTAPTAIRSFMAQGDEIPRKYNLSSLKLLGSVGEPINPAAWHWYHQVIGDKRLPVVDTWWQTETGAMMMTPLPGEEAIPGYAHGPLPGLHVDLLDPQTARPLPAGEGEGALVVTRPWPSMARTIYGDHQRYLKTYFQPYPGYYCTGDGAYRSPEGQYQLRGRIDDVLNVSGHRLGTAEIESALVKHPWVAEAAVVGAPDDIKGEHICCFLRAITDFRGQVLQGSPDSPDLLKLKGELNDLVVKEVGKLARPDQIVWVEDLPKTRSGKIMRRLLRQIAHGQKDNWGDVTTLNAPEILDHIQERFQQSKKKGTP